MKDLSHIPGKLLTVAGILSIIMLAACTLTTASTICHATGDPAHPYQQLTVDSTQLLVHQGHLNDIIPAPAAGCPANPSATATAGLSTTNGKITICHATGSKKNPYVEITVSVNGLNGHDKHSGDIIPAPAGGCPTNKP